MHNRFFKVEQATGFVSAILIGHSPRPGVTFVEQSAETAHVTVGWSLVDGQWVDTREAYKTHLAVIRGDGTQGFLASLPEA